MPLTKKDVQEIVTEGLKETNQRLEGIYSRLDALSFDLQRVESETVELRAGLAAYLAEKERIGLFGDVFGRSRSTDRREYKVFHVARRSIVDTPEQVGYRSIVPR